ncbi:MAG TPA: hypothetical protein VJT71_03815 [Pyrinomonadaceae bacterium]|nr:hypothetical protein [Pyrinomonadaceae bacterium]
MKLVLASILSAAALLVGVLAQTDWKPYSSAGNLSASFPDDAPAATILTETDTGLLFSNLTRKIGEDSQAPEKILNRTREILKQDIKTTESPVTIAAAKNGPSFTLLDRAGHPLNVKLDFDEHSFEMLARGLSKKSLAKVGKVVKTLNLPEIVERELRNEMRSQGWVITERRESKREEPDEPKRAECPDRAEPAESKREQGESIRAERAERAGRDSMIQP